MKNNFRILMLIGPCESSRILYHALSEDFNIEHVILEQKVPARRLLLSRVRKLGLLTVLGQILFIACNKLLFSPLSKGRKREIMQGSSFKCAEIPRYKVTNVESVNCQEVETLLKAIMPDVVLVNGTRIISQKVLDCIDVPFINTHVGITPKYRGVHGAYWSLVEKDKVHCGVTVHLVDKGVDTGSVLYQAIINPNKEDSFNTYPLLQLNAAVPLLNSALNDIKFNRLKPLLVNTQSHLWTHPTLLQYFKNWFFHGVR